MEIRASLRQGSLAGTISIFAILLGLTGLMGTLVTGWFGFASSVPGAWLLLGLVVFWIANRAARDLASSDWRAVALTGALIGLVDGVLLGLVTAWMGSLMANEIDVRSWLVQITPDAVALLTLGQRPLLAGLVMLLAMTVIGLAGALFAWVSMRNDWSKKIQSRWLAARESVIESKPVASFVALPHARQIMIGVALILLLLLPLVAGRYWNYTLGTVGIYVILGLGLNVVVGLAGLLDLGYVAFFAIGSFTVAMLTAPQPHNIMMNYWLTLPIAVALAATAGGLLGLSVLRVRGDYLAIVTLGFGEIIRILSKSDVLTDFTGGPRGIRAVGGPTFFGNNVGSPAFFMYFILFGIVLVAFATSRLRNSRVGRAWMAMREDEDVAEAMGVNILKYKLLAFAIGAGFAGFAGAIFASRNKFTGPEDFTLLVSINVLSLVIIGGMGSIPGVVVGALVLKGLPEILRQLDDYRMLAFGALLVVMMIVKPEGLWPSARRRMELYDGEGGALGEGDAVEVRS